MFKCCLLTGHNISNQCGASGQEPEFHCISVSDIIQIATANKSRPGPEIEVAGSVAPSHVIDNYSWAVRNCQWLARHFTNALVAIPEEAPHHVAHRCNFDGQREPVTGDRLLKCLRDWQTRFLKCD